MKKLIKSIIPPIAFSLYKKMSILVYKYKGTAVDHYDDTTLAEMVIKKNIAFKNKINAENVLDMGALRTITWNWLG